MHADLPMHFCMADPQHALSATQNVFSHIPLMFPMNFRSKYDYALHTVPQEHAGMKRKFWPRGTFTHWFHCRASHTTLVFLGKILGGCKVRSFYVFICP